MNKLTILIDGGFLCMRTMFAFERGFAIDNTPAQKNATAVSFKETLSRTLTKIINQFPGADNLVLMSEGGSWRKQLPIPKQLEGITYKGHRERKVETDWNAIYKAYNEFVDNCREAGITCSQHSMIEGDDWAWYWSRRLNKEGVNCIIWTSDCDLKQLVQVDGNTFTGWFNDKVGLVLPPQCQWPDDPMEAMINPPFQSAVLESLIHKLKKVSYINPDSIVINKVICGDAGDNIKSVIRYKKGTRTYRFAESDFKKLQGNFHLENMNDFRANFTQIAEYISSNPKFIPYNIQAADVKEMLEYNLQLVWLNEEILPTPITTAMVQFEYKQFNVNDIRHNSVMLSGQNSSIEDIFNGAV